MKTITLYADNGAPVRLIDNGKSIIIVSRLGTIETRDMEYVQFWLRQFGVTQAPRMLARQPSKERGRV